MNPVHNTLKVKIVGSPQEAKDQGHDYSKAPAGEFKPIRVKEVVVTRGGMVSGASTVDFILEDEKGQKYVFLVTGNLLKTIPC